LSVLNDKEALQHSAPRGIGGWLILLLLDLWIIAAVRLAFGISGLLLVFRGIHAPMVPAVHGPLPAAVSVLAGATGVVTGFLLARKNPKGPTIAKILFFLEIGYYLASLFIVLLSVTPAVADALPPWVKPAGFLLSSVLWLGYLFSSRRVATTYSGEPEPEPPPVLEAPDVSRLRVGAWEECRPAPPPSTDPEPEPDRHLEPEFVTEPELKEEPEFLPEPTIDLALRLGIKPDSEPNLQSNTRFELQPELEPEAEFESEPESESEFKDESNFLPEPKIDLALRLGFRRNPEPDPQANVRLEPEPEFKLEPATQIGTESKFITEPRFLSEPEPTLNFEPAFKSEPEPELTFEPDLEPEPDLRFKWEPEPKSVPEPEQIFQPESEPEPELEPEPDPELDLITLKARIAAGVTLWLSSSSLHAHATFLRDAGASTDPEKFHRRLLDQVNAICDHAWSVHTGESPTLPNTPDSNGSITDELQKWAIAQAASKLTRCLDIRAAIEANSPFETMVEDRDYILAIVEKNASGDAFDRRMELEKYASHSGPEIVSQLIQQAQRDMFEAHLWAQVATFAGDQDFLKRFEEAGAKAFQSSSHHWRTYVTKVREGQLRPVGV
jgi:hypothetical protein